MKSFLDQLDQAMADFSDRDAFVSSSASKTSVKTFADVAAEVEKTESWLRQSGCKKGDRIAALTFNCTEAVILEWATYRLGCTWIGIPTLERNLANLERLLKDFTPRLLLVEPAALGLFEMRTLSSLPAFACEEVDLPSHFDAARFRLLRRTGPGPTADDFFVREKRVVRIRYTSGATGDPKAIAYTQGTAVAILNNIRNVIFPTSEEPVETVVHGLPSVWAAGSLIAPAFCRGGKNVLLPRWDLSRFVEAMAQEKRTLTFLVPGQVADLTQYSERSGPGWASSLHRVLVAGGPAPISTMRRAKEILPYVRFFITFGQTEASFPVTLHEVSDRDVDPATNRRPFVPLGRVTRPYKESEVDQETGEFKLRGEAVAAGMWNTKTHSFLPLDYPHATGDLVERDSDEVLHYLGRRGSLADIRKGRPAPEAIEALVRECPGVKRARVDRFKDSASGVRVDLTVEPSADRIEKATLLDFFYRRRDATNLASISLGALRFGEVQLTMSGKVKRNVQEA